METKRKKVGIALGSGGAKGYAHIGVLKVLEENNIPIDFIAGSSAGAVVGSLYSLYKDTKKVEETLTDFHKIRSLLDISLKGGLIKGKKIINFFENKFEDKRFKDLSIPMCVIATDYNTGEEVRIKNGNIALAVRASMAVPFVFELVDCGKRELCDGGLSSPVPIKALKEMGADVVIGVRIEDKVMNTKKKNIYSMTERSFAIMQHRLSEYELKECDVLIDPYFEDYGILGIHKIFQGKTFDAIEEGERSTKERLSAIKKSVGIEEEISGIYKL
ncbi:MAG: patatin-like phospholipase family protein [Candidatus Pacebacteria bacterium]|nr:patatin-like phospholipase family protein [Candidatus Paceibacterota bacterium]